MLSTCQICEQRLSWFLFRVQKLQRDRCAEVLLGGQNRANRRINFLDCTFLEQVTIAASVQRSSQNVLVVMKRKKNDAGPKSGLSNLACNFQSAQLRHLDVENRQIRIHLLDQNPRC